MRSIKPFWFSLLILISAVPAFGAFTATKVLVMKNQFGEQSINTISSDGLPLGHSVTYFSGSGAPTNGIAGTGLNFAGPGSIYGRRDTGVIYVNTNTAASPTWTLVAAGASGVTSSLLTGYVSASGTVAAGDTLLVGINKLNGNQVLSKATADAALPSASFTDAAVTSKLITGYVSGAGTVAASDTILQALNKLNGNIGVYSESSPSLTFDHSVGAKTIVTRTIGKFVSVSIPAGAISDGVGTVCATTAGLAAGLRPAAAVTHPAVVIDNGTTRKAGQVVVGSDGVLTFSVLGTGFTNAAAAGWDAVSVSYAIP